MELKKKIIQSDIAEIMVQDKTEIHARTFSAHLEYFVEESRKIENKMSGRPRLKSQDFLNLFQEYKLFINFHRETF